MPMPVMDPLMMNADNQFLQKAINFGYGGFVNNFDDDPDGQLK